MAFTHLIQIHNKKRYTESRQCPVRASVKLGKGGFVRHIGEELTVGTS